MAFVLVLSLGFSKSTWADRLEDTYIEGATIFTICSFLAAFTLIPVCTNLERINDQNCQVSLENDKCNLIHNLLFDANLSWRGLLAGLGAGFVSLLIGSCVSSAPGGLGSTTGKAGYHAAIVALGIGVLISHGSALALDISLWKRWNQVKQLGEHQRTNAILGGATANGVLQIIPYASLFTFGLIELVSRLYRHET